MSALGPASPTFDYASSWHNLNRALDTRMLAHRGGEILRFLDRLGVRVPPSNRLQEAVKTINLLNDGKLVPTPGDRGVLERTSEAMRALWEALFIMHAIITRRQVQAFPRSSLRYLLKGALVSRGESNSEAANRRFELYVTAALVLSGVEVMAVEPDLKMRYYDEYLGIAAKRVHVISTSGLFEHLKDGAGQIANQGMRGMLALSLDPWLDSLNTNGDPEAVGESFNLAVAEVHRLFERLGDRPAAIGAMLFGTRLGWTFECEKPAIQSSWPLQVVGFMDLESQGRFHDFFEVGLYPRVYNAVREVAALVS